MKEISTSQLRLVITKEGQRFKDEPVFNIVSEPCRLSFSVRQAAESFARPAANEDSNDGPVEAVVKAHLKRAGMLFQPAPSLEPIKELTHYERTPLRWMRPDGKGGLVPKVA